MTKAGECGILTKLSGNGRRFWKVEGRLGAEKVLEKRMKKALDKRPET